MSELRGVLPDAFVKAHERDVEVNNVLYNAFTLARQYTASERMLHSLSELHDQRKKGSVGDLGERRYQVFTRDWAARREKFINLTKTLSSLGFLVDNSPEVYWPEKVEDMW